MIFVTVGEQLPFDRLINIVDSWAKETRQEVFAQIGKSSLKPVNMHFEKFLSPKKFKEKFLDADIIIAHAGMGTIIASLELGKPILVMPRQAILGEHRNDHQFATAKRFLELNYIEVGFDDEELRESLQNIDSIVKGMTQKKDNGPSPLLIETIRGFVNGS